MFKQRRLTNFLIAGGLTSFVGGLYYYTCNVVHKDDVNAQLERVRPPFPTPSFLAWASNPPHSFSRRRRRQEVAKAAKQTAAKKQ